MILHSSCINNAKHAPKGGSNIQIYLSSPPKEWEWGARKGEKAGQYAAVKQRVIQDVMENVCTIIPELEDKSLIEVCEMGTPLTFERFTGNKNGPHCGFTWDRARNKINPKMGTCDTRHSKITNLLITGHWTGYLGGITNAFASARQVTKQIKEI